MPSLSEIQDNFIDAINNGPGRLQNHLFSGPVDRVFLGLAAHANTISHARLVALEQTFPRTLEHLGKPSFNNISRDFVDTANARASDPSSIGRQFPDFLPDPASRELARIEWAWLQAYNAAEAEPLTLADLNGIDERSLLKMPVAPHPSARAVSISCPIAAALHELAGVQPKVVLCIRPHAEVKLLALDDVQSAIFSGSSAIDVVLGNLLHIAIEQSEEEAALAPILELISAGTLIKTG
ncbi:MAG: putative DNA-binding domain-containing protein [Sphingorhabdus sp.]